MVELVHGVDMIGATLQGYAGQEPAVTMKEASGAAIRYLILPPGNVTAIDGIEDAAASPGVVRCDVDLQIGAKLEGFNNSNERHGYVLAVGQNAAEAIRNAEAALNKIQIAVD
jgi:biotin carboxylase